MLITDGRPLAAGLPAAQACAPEGVTIRPWQEPADFDRMVEVFRRARTVDGIGWEITAASIEADVRGLGFRPEETILLAEAGGTVVGFGRLTDFGTSRDDGRMLNHTGHVDPTCRERGIGRALLAGLQAELARVRSLRPDPAGTRAGFQSTVFAANTSTIGLLVGAGYQPHRFMIEMTRPLDDVSEVPLPAGITSRPVGADDRLAVIRAMDEAMRDERGWPGMPDETLLAMVEHPNRGQFDVWQVAWDDDRVVGGVLGYIDEAENRALSRRRGYTEQIFTIRGWRGRGIASALITRNLRLLQDRGMTEAALSVDTGNPSGALALYERHGFREHDRVILYRKELPPAD
jgi:GNAT superfamily N-acetyltransferase